MSIRKVLAWYLGALLFVGITGASAYRVLEQQRSQAITAGADATPAATVAMADTPPAPSIEPPAALSLPPLPQLRPHVGAPARKSPPRRSSARTADASKSAPRRAFIRTAAQPPRPAVPAPRYAYRVYGPSGAGYTYYVYYPQYGYYPYAYYSAN